MTPALQRSIPGLPAVAQRKVVAISAGWVLVALAEAAAYTTLGASIVRQQGPTWVLVTAAVAIAVTVLVSRSGYITGASLAADLYRTVGEVLSQAKLSWFTDPNRALAGDVAGRTIPSLMSVPAHQLQSLLVSPLLPLLLVIGVWIVGDGWLAAVVAVLIGASFVAQVAAQRALARADAARGRSEHEANEAAYEFLDHLELLRSALGNRHAADRLADRWEAQERALRSTNRATATATFLSAAVSVLPVLGVILWVSVTGAYDATVFLATVILALRASAPIEALALAGLSVNDLRHALTRLDAIVSAPALPEPTRAGPVTGHVIELEGLSHPPALSDVSAVVPEGARVLVEGPTGSGKSTLLSLLLRFDDPDAGRVLLGGTDLRELQQAQLMEHIAYVPQHPDVFSGTLAENIRLGNPAASDDAVIEAARRAALGEVIARSPLGVHQEAGHRGANLSGGERQRVAIARALLKNAPILVLDEATSALDAQAERTVAESIAATRGTVILVTHRSPEIWIPTLRVKLSGERERPLA
ncbi:ABC transporter family protein [Leucobacter komagatae]|uniref:ABC transporter family protein n=1 Tax=Leucobacter komagatae TaxID=55969 RepID=A0A542Y1Z0_9MICO|nr:ABC transporter ATP-binding protein [Leucobacter komagatae]TQL42102.1 ABC transporter family protein [Leucobacter komagatae]